MAVESDSRFEIRDGSTDRLVIDTDGNVGVGGTTTSSRLTVDGNLRVDGGITAFDDDDDLGFQVSFFGGASDLRLRTRNDFGDLSTTVELQGLDGTAGDGGGRMLVRNSRGNITLDLDGDRDDAGYLTVRDNNVDRIVLDADWDNTGTSRIVTDVLQINGADLSEQFDIRGDIPIKAGLVVSIDPENPGKLVVTEDAYDKKVAGIVSGAGGVRTGLLMGQEGTLASGDHAVALTGRVWCYVDATFGAIRPGDMLTTSRTPGHAMLASNDERARGAVIGKAMTGLDHGTGMVLVLVNLQ